MKRKSLLLSIPLALTLGLCGCSVQAEVGEPTVAGSVSDNTGTEEKKEPEAQAVNVGEMFTVPDMFEITLHNAEWQDEMKSGNETFGTVYGPDEQDASYLVINATVKNIGTTNESLSSFGVNSSAHLGAQFKINDKYELDAEARVVYSGEDGFAGTDFEIEPLKTQEVKFYASVSDEIKNAFEGVELTLAARQPNEEGVWEMDEEPIGTYVANFQ